jgi:hypothetical protein
MTAAVQEPASLERLLGTVGEAMTRAVALLAADMPAEWALRHLDRQAVSGAPGGRPRLGGRGDHPPRPARPRPRAGQLRQPAGPASGSGT